QMPHFHTIHNHRVACFELVRLVVSPVDVVAEASPNDHLIVALRENTAYIAIKAAIEAGIVFDGVRLVRTPEGMDAHRLDGSIPIELCEVTDVGGALRITAECPAKQVAVAEGNDVDERPIPTGAGAQAGVV